MFFNCACRFPRVSVILTLFVVTCVVVQCSEAGTSACPRRCLCSAISSTTAAGTATSRATPTDSEITDAATPAAETTRNETFDSRQMIYEDENEQQLSATLPPNTGTVAAMRINCRNRRIVELVDMFKDTSRDGAFSL
jgi:hypothetical protein